MLMRSFACSLTTALILSSSGCLLPQNEAIAPSDGDDDTATGADAGANPVDDDNPDPEDPPVVDDGRVKDGLQAIWKFEDGDGAIATDTSGTGDPLNLTVADPAAVQWLPDGALRVTAPTILTAAAPPTKILNACTVSSEITIEAWLAPANLEQTGPARIVTYSLDTQTRNFTLAQDAVEYDVRLRTAETNDNGTPATATGGNAVQVAPQHVVYTRGLQGTRIYVDDILVGNQGLGGTMAEWDPEHTFAMANEITLDRPWLGDLHLVAIYCRALSKAEITQNYTAGHTVAQ